MNKSKIKGKDLNGKNKNKGKDKKPASKAEKALTIGLVVLVAAALVLDIYLVLDRYVLDKPAAETTASSALRLGDYIYKVTEDNSALLLSYYGSAETVELPAELDGYPLTVLGEDCFAYAFSVKKLLIPESVKTIGAYAFSNCEELREIYIPKSITSIGQGAFYFCSALGKVYYEGTREDWIALNIPPEDNNALSNAVYFYNYNKD